MEICLIEEGSIVSFVISIIVTVHPIVCIIHILFFLSLLILLLEVLVGCLIQIQIVENIAKIIALSSHSIFKESMIFLRSI
jgi:hypothetical protein